MNKLELCIYNGYRKFLMTQQNCSFTEATKTLDNSSIIEDIKSCAVLYTQTKRLVLYSLYSDNHQIEDILFIENYVRTNYV